MPISFGRFAAKLSADCLKLRDREQSDVATATTDEGERRETAFRVYRIALRDRQKHRLGRRYPVVLMADCAGLMLRKRLHQPMQISVVSHLGPSLEHAA